MSPSSGCILYMHVIADCDIERLSSEDYDNSSSTSLLSEYSEEVELSVPSSEVEVHPYRFEPELPLIDIDDGSSEEDNSANILPANRVGNIEW